MVSRPKTSISSSWLFLSFIMVMLFLLAVMLLGMSSPACQDERTCLFCYLCYVCCYAELGCFFVMDHEVYAKGYQNCFCLEMYLFDLLCGMLTNHTISASVIDSRLNVTWMITRVYGPQGEFDKKIFIRELRQLRQTTLPNWLILGYFNLMYQDADKSNSRVNRRLMLRFRACLVQLQLWLKQLQLWLLWLNIFFYRSQNLFRKNI